MVTRIQSVHFDASQQLMEFVEKKVAKLDKLCEGATALEVTRIRKSHCVFRQPAVIFLPQRQATLLKMLFLVQLTR